MGKIDSMKNDQSRSIKKGGRTVDPLTLIIVIIMAIFFFPLIIRGVGCLLRTIAIVVLVIGALILLGMFF